MKNLGTYIMLAVVGAGLLILGIVAIGKGKAPVGNGELFAALHAAAVGPDAITGLDIEVVGSPAVSFVRDGEGSPWRMVKPVDTRVNGTEIDDIVKQLLEVKAVEKVKDLTPNRKQHGLEPPGATATVRKGGSLSATISLGELSYGEKPLLFVLSSDDPLRPQAIRKDAIRSLFKVVPPKDATTAAELVRGASDFRQTNLLRGSFGDVLVNTDAIRLSTGTAAMSIRKALGGIWNFVEPANFGTAEADISTATTPEDINSVRRLLETAFNIAVANPADFVDDLSDLDKFGLDPAKNPGLLRIELERSASAGGKIALLVGNMVGDNVDQHYVRIEGESFAAKVPSSPIRALQKVLAKPLSVRNKTFATIASGRVDAIDLSVDGTKFELRQSAETPPGWKVYDGGKVSVASTPAVEVLIEALSKPRTVVDFPDGKKPDAETGLAAPSVAIKLWYGGIVRPKEGDKVDPNAVPPTKPTADVELLFGKGEVAARYARRLEAGQKFDALVTEDLYRTVAKPRLEYLDAAVKSFSPDNVARLSYTRGAETFVLEKDAKAGTWTIAAPEARKGRAADAGKVGAILTALGSMRAGKIVADRADDAQLARLKLSAKEPKLKVTLSMVGDKSEKVYLFGDETSDKLSAFALPPDSTLVIEVGKAVPNSFDGEIQDMVMYRLDQSKVTRLKLTGWAGLLGAPISREVILKDGKWAFKEDPGYPLDAALVTNFLQDIVAPKGEEIVPGKAADPIYGLDVKKDAIVVEIEEGGKPIVLTIGAKKDDRSVYATSSKQPGDVFVLLRDRFKGVMSPKVFAGK